MRSLITGAALLACWAQVARADAPGQPPVPIGEHARRLLDEAILASATAARPDATPDLVPRFKLAAEAAPHWAPALLDYAIALDRAAILEQAEAAYLAAAGAPDFPELRFTAAARAASLALDRGDAEAARAAVTLARAALPDDAAPYLLQARVALRLHDPGGAQAAARSALVRDPQDSEALCVLARAHLAQGNAGVARLFAARAAKVDPEDAEPILVQAEIARGTGDPAAELAAAQAAAEADAESADAALALGRALYERGLTAAALEQLSRAAELEPDAPAIRLALGTVLAEEGQKPQAEEQLLRAAKRAPAWPEPHLELARLKELQGDAKTALAEAKVFLRLSVRAPPPGHPIHALVQRCEETLRTRTQASVVQ
jgi:tetratricopeptide (TPR) repeat protein